MLGWLAHIKTARFQSTPPVRGATCVAGKCPLAQNISIHAPRAGGDTVCLKNPLIYTAFQSTPPVRGATTRTAVTD